MYRNWQRAVPEKPIQNISCIKGHSENSERGERLQKLFKHFRGKMHTMKLQSNLQFRLPLVSKIKMMEFPEWSKV